MRRWIPAVILPFGLTLASASLALAPGDAARGFRDGASHRLGDDGFVEVFGREPGPTDSEGLRMHVHFEHVRSWLLARPPTRPDLAARRQEILGYLGEYIAKGTTPQNAHVPWRAPVFIDDHGTICAVGYLIERTAGRALAERVAREHRYDLLEDIAAKMPEVGTWVEGSGLSLEELASIQPGYIPPAYWNEADFEDGPVDGSPLALDVEAASGRWTSRYPNGARLAEGRYVNKRPEGTWSFFHPSGNLAAVGSFQAGVRSGQWTFFHDSKGQVRRAEGSFVNGVIVDEWRHFNERGTLVGRSRPVSPWSFKGAGFLVDVEGSDHRAHHWVHQAEIAGTRHRLDLLADGGERIYVPEGQETAFDERGRKLDRIGGAWEASECHWGRREKATARAGDVVTLHAMLLHGPSVCDGPRPVSSARAKHLDAIFLSLRERTAADTVSSALARDVAKPRVRVMEM